MNLSLKRYARQFVWALALVSGFTVISSCSNGGGLNVFSIEDDIKLGKQLADEIAADPVKYPVLDETQYATSYNHIRRITNNILNSGKLKYRDKFVWQIKIIRDDSTLNAFCAPGGYIYVYTGLIKFLQQENELAGVLGHEIAHADLRHSTDRLTQQYGIQTLLDLLLGDKQGTLTQVAASLTTLAYSRSNETQADEYSVDYLCGTEYDANGTAGFFEKLISSGQSGKTPAFLSTHPNPENRVQNINAKKDALNCTANGTFDARYQELKNSLP